MRKFYVTYRICNMCGLYDTNSTTITLNKGEKAHPLIFKNKLREKYIVGAGELIELISWSLIEE
jgi:hypothetical protein